MLPRGIRNNNPLNIRIGCKWKGEVANPTDKDFEQFTCMHYGVRAGFLLLQRYIERYHLDTIAKIISRWAPATENATQTYIKFVCKKTGLGANEKISFFNQRAMVELVDAMILVECGTTIDKDIIIEAYAMVIAPNLLKT